MPAHHRYLRLVLLITIMLLVAGFIFLIGVLAYDISYSIREQLQSTSRQKKAVADEAVKFEYTNDTTKITMGSTLYSREGATNLSSLQYPIAVISIIYTQISIIKEIFDMLDKFSLLSIVPSVFALFLSLLLLKYQSIMHSIKRVMQKIASIQTPVVDKNTVRIAKVELPQPLTTSQPVQNDEDLVIPLPLASAKIYNEHLSPMVKTKVEEITSDQERYEPALLALKQGDPEEVIHLATAMFQLDFHAWTKLLQEVEQTNGSSGYLNIKKHTLASLQRFIELQDINAYNEAVVLCRWQLSSTKPGDLKSADVYYYLGVADSYLSFIATKQDVVLIDKRNWYKLALDIYKREKHLTYQRAAISHNMGCDDLNESPLAREDSEKLILSAIQDFKATLRLCKTSDFATIKRTTYCHLGFAYYKQYQLQQSNEKTELDRISFLFYWLMGIGPRKLRLAISCYRRARSSYETNDEISNEQVDLYICLSSIYKELYNVVHRKKFLIRSFAFHNDCLEILERMPNHWYLPYIHKDGEYFQKYLQNIV